MTPPSPPNTERLRREIAELESLYASAPVGLVFVDRDLRFVRLNAAMAAINGRPIADHLGRTLREVFGDAAAAIEGLFRQVLETGEPIRDHELYADNALGIHRDYLVSYFPVRDSEGTILGVNGVVQDITERRRAESSFRDSEERLRLALSAGRVGVWDWDIVNDRIVWSDRIYEMHGVPIGTPPGGVEEFRKLVHPDDLPRVGAAIGEALQTGREYTMEFRTIRNDGEVRWLSTHGQTVYDGAGRPLRMLGATIDTTERKQWEDTLVSHAQELASSNADLQQFAYITSHDLQEPLRMIASYAQLLARRYKGRLEPDADEFIGQITGGVERMATLINDLLVYSRVVNADSIPPEPVDLSEAIHDALENLAAAIQLSNATVSVGELPRVKGNSVELAQLFQNLIGNAIKYRSEAAPQVNITAERKDGMWIVTVRDNGIGIDPKYHDRIFGVFKRLHGRSIPGTGMGLAICRKIVERHGGRIWVESEASRGAAFRFSLPAREIQTAVSS